MDTLVERDFTISPTFAVKEATREGALPLEGI